jgi:hypothetical protein
MVELLHRERTIKVKIVYYGPPVGGKTTNLQVLHRNALGLRRGEMISINSAQDRTILFDLLPLRSTGFRGFDLRLQVLAVPGQAMYAATRRLVLKGADSIVFVANSAADRWEENIQSFREMTQNLLAHQLDPSALPLVLQFNKRDLPDVTPFDFMERALNARKVDVFAAVAVRGDGVLETFSAILLRTVQDLSARYQIVETARGQSLSQWTDQTVRGMFGRATLTQEPEPGAERAPSVSAAGATPPVSQAQNASSGTGPQPIVQVDAPARRMVRVALPEEAVRLAATSGPDGRANETLVESYAQASQQLSAALTELREERDQARQRLADLLAALASAQDVLSGQPLEPLLQGLLTRMTEGARATCGSFLVPREQDGLRAAALTGLAQEALLPLAVGARVLAARMQTDQEPRLHLAADNLDLGDALDQAERPLVAVVSVPVRTPRGLRGLALLYYSPDAALPRADDLTHLGAMARAIAAPLELAQALATVSDARQSLHLAMAGTASIHGFDEILSLLVKLRERLGALRRRADAPDWLLEHSAMASPLLAGALAAARSLSAFTRGEIEHEPVRLSELTEELAPGLSVSTEPGADVVSGDPALLRVALRALIEVLRGPLGGDNGADSLHLQASAEGQGVRIAIPHAPRHPALPPETQGPEGGVALARRIAEMHGGSLLIERNADGALRFTLHLRAA